MQGSIRIIEPDAPAEEPTPPRFPRFVVPVAAAVIALSFGAGYLFGSSGETEQPQVAAPAPDGFPDFVAPPGTTPFDPVIKEPSEIAPTTQPPRLSELVPGFEGALTFVNNDSTRVGVWRNTSRQPNFAAGLPQEIGSIAVDATGTAIAYTEGRNARPTLYAGPLDSAQPIAVGVKAFGWHQSSRRFLAWIGPNQLGDEANWLVVNDFVLDVVHPITELPPRDESFEDYFYNIRGWGDWGFLVMEQVWNVDDEQTTWYLITPDGQISEPWDATWVAFVSSTGRFALTDDGGIVTITNTTGDVLGTLSTAAMWSAVFSRDGHQVASITEDGRLSLIYIGESLDDNPPTIEFDVYGYPLGFTADGDFLVAVGQGTEEEYIAIIDLLTVEVYRIPMPAGLHLTGVR